MEPSRFDVVVIGGGQAAAPLAFDLAAAGKTVALVERKHLGGSCVNFGCIPTKAALASARLAHRARRAEELGLRIPSVESDFAAVLERARGLSADSRGGLEKSFEDSDNPRLLQGHARLAGRHGDLFSILVEDTAVEARQVVLDTGTRSIVPPIEGLDDLDALTAENWLERPELPASLLVLGGGAIGLEMGQFYRRMGSQVTIVEATDQILGPEDADVASAVEACLEDEDIAFQVGKRVTAVRGRSGALQVELEDDGRRSQIEVSQLFVAVGRRPNTDDLGLDTVGVQVDDKGFVIVDERLATSVEGVWAAGDIRGGAQFTHTSWDDYRVLASQFLGDGSRTTDRLEPYAVFTDPELGRAGLTERQAREEGHEIAVAKMELAKTGKARLIGETQGLVKVVIETDSRRILGAAVLAAHGAELVHTYLAVMSAGAPYTAIPDTMHIHPTLSEALHTVLDTLDLEAER